MLLYGLHFSHLVVFAHTARVTGWPVVSRAWDEVVELYFNARATIKKVRAYQPLPALRGA
jgi:hypothetical protein